MYSDEEQKSSGYEQSKQKYVQMYRLGYAGNVYSPRLLDYTLEGVLKYDNEDMQSNGNKNTVKNDNYEYKLDLDFIKGTKYPFTIYANTQSTPVTAVNYNSVTYSKYDMESRGVNGSMDFTPFKVTYGASNSIGVSESSYSSQTTETTDYQTAFMYETKKQDLRIAYQHTEEKIIFNIADSNITNGDTTMQGQDLLNIFHRWSISDYWKLNSAISYQQDNFYATKNTNANVDLEWTPQAKYSASLNMTGSKFEYSEGAMNMYSINQDFRYKVTPTLTISETIFASTIDSDVMSSDSTNLILRANHIYDKTIFQDTSLKINTSLNAQESDLKTASYRENNSTSTNITKEIYNLNVNLGTSTPLPSIKSSAYFRTAYSQMLSSEDEEQQTYNINLSISSKILSIISNSIDARYVQSDSIFYRSTGEAVNNSATLRSLSESVSVPLRLGIRGSVNLRVGVTNMVTANNGITRSSTSPMANLNLNYRFFTKLMFRSDLSINQSFDTLTYTGSANLTYEVGKTFLSMSYQYNKSETEAYNGLTENEKSSFRVNLTRKF